MRVFRDIVARRRPSVENSQGTQDTHVRSEAASQKAAQQPDLGQVEASETCEDFDLDRAREGRSFVPKPTAPPVAKQTDWNESDLPTAPNASVMGSEPPARRKSKPKIWDLPPTVGGPDEPNPQPLATTTAPARDGNAYPPEMRDACVADTTPNVKQPEHAAPVEPERRMPRETTSTRVKTRLIGFHGDAITPDVMASTPAAAKSYDPQFPVGWLVVVDGPGRGASFTLTQGLSTIGRDLDQTVALDFGDTSISRERHVSIAYDDEENKLFIGHGGKSNIVRLNQKPLLTTEELQGGDIIKIGKTVLQFVAFCTPEFSWNASSEEGEASDA